ncbi:hypothetical protein T492DRAFT_984775 [Pavlovales sp. CCMP2436]|nr:hypothetical protein T492DRAFT_984775 [Pavlovales sp. CCMP2436]
MLLRRAPSSLASAISAFAAGRHRTAVGLLEAAQPPVFEPEPTASKVSPERMMAQRLSTNLTGLLSHYSGDYGKAATELAASLQACEALGRSGMGSDSFTDLSGLLVDIAVTDIARGEIERAEGHLKRARYMAIRAYRPDPRVVIAIETARAELALCKGEPLAALQHSLDAHAAQPGPPTPNPLQAAATAIKSSNIKSSNTAAATATAAERAVQQANAASDLRVSASAACVRVSALRQNGLGDEALQLSSQALEHFEANLLLTLDAAALPLLHARLLLSDALATASVNGSRIDVRLGLEHARLLLVAELGEQHPHCKLMENNLRSFSGQSPLPLRDLLMLPPGLGLGDSDPFKLSWRPVGVSL